jgi:uncharacterized lipoprotein YddW (UPF0748 family)
MAKKFCIVLIFILLFSLMRLPKCYSGNKEIRGIWFNPFASDVKLPKNYTLAKIKLYDFFECWNERNITEVFMNVKTFENVMYKTSVPILRNPWGFDVLALACELAEDFNISIHAWIPLRTNISEWQQVDINGKRSLIFNFALPEAQSHIYSIINELLNYPIKGIHLDYIRYEGKNYGFDDYSVKAFINKTGIDPRENPDHPQWIEWRKRQVSNIVNQTKIIVKNHDLKLQLSVACFTHPENVLQDWFNWQKQDLIDFACPINYEKDPLVFENNIKYMLNQGINKNRILMGIGIWQINEETFKKEVEITRKYGFAGFVLFRDVYLVWPIPPIPPLTSTELLYHNPYVFAIIAFGTIACIYFFTKYALKFIHTRTRKRSLRRNIQLK